VPDGVRYIVEGRAEMTALADDGRILKIADFDRDDAIGLTAVTRQGIASSVTAVTDLAVLHVPVGVLDELIDRTPALARAYGREIDHRRLRTVEAFEAAGLEPPRGSRLLAY
jgi:CRP-like cAMP-binding protein